ncbi:unnamed protein product, partial [marine sediment metagenome]
GQKFDLELGLPGSAPSLFAALSDSHAAISKSLVPIG